MLLRFSFPNTRRHRRQQRNVLWEGKPDENRRGRGTRGPGIKGRPSVAQKGTARCSGWTQSLEGSPSLLCASVTATVQRKQYCPRQSCCASKQNDNPKVQRARLAQGRCSLQSPLVLKATGAAAVFRGSVAGPQWPRNSPARAPEALTLTSWGCRSLTPQGKRLRSRSLSSEGLKSCEE